MNKETLPVRIRADVVHYVKKQGIYGETFSDILHRLLELHKQRKPTKLTQRQKEIKNKL